MTSNPISSIASLRGFWRRLRADRQGNMLMMMGFAVIPLTLAIGFGVDYSRAERLQTQLNAIADSAALAAVAPTMLCQSSASASTAATNMFNTQAATLVGISGTITPTVTINPSAAAAGCSGSLRTATVTYTAKVTTLVTGMLGVKTLPIGGSAIANASQPPSINFYVAMDTSPSMLLPTTSTGITQMMAGSYWGGAAASGWSPMGCDFACHAIDGQNQNYGTFIKDINGYAVYTTSFDPVAGVTRYNTYRINCANNNVYDGLNKQIGYGGSITNSPATACGGTFWSGGNNYFFGAANLYYTPCTYNAGPPATCPATSRDAYGNPITTNVSVYFPDSWWLAENYSTINPGQSNIPLRLDQETPAAQNLTTYAYNIEQNYASAPTPPVYKLQFFTFDMGAPSVVPTAPWNALTDVATSHTSTFPNMSANAPVEQINSNGTDQWKGSQYSTVGFTDITSALSGMQSNMPATSGIGTPSNPQNVLILITDGAQNLQGNAAQTYGSLTAAQIAQCTAIKATGTRIAILYTEYIPGTVNYTPNTPWINFAAGTSNFASTGIPTIASQLQACSTQNPDGSYLMQTVSTNGDISAALNQLFSMAVQSARLVQ